MNEAEQRLFWRFSAFVEEQPSKELRLFATPGRTWDRSIEGLASLLDKNLVQRVDSPDVEPRFTMLETIREYALERLSTSGEEPQTRRSHAAYCVVIAEEGNPHWMPLRKPSGLPM